MVSSIDFKPVGSSQILPVDVFLIFSEQERGMGEKIHESLMREGLIVGEKPVGVTGTAGEQAIAEGIEKAGTIVYLVSANGRQSQLCQQELALALAHNKRIIPLLVEAAPEKESLTPAILPAIDFTHYRDEGQYRGRIEQLVREIRQGSKVAAGRKPATVQPPATPVAVKKEKSERRQLAILRSLLAATTIGLIAAISFGIPLYQKYQSASRNEAITLQQEEKTIAELNDLNQVKAQLATANTKAAEALQAEQEAKAERKLLNDRLYEANAKLGAAIKSEQQAQAERKLLNDRLYEANAKLGTAIKSEQQAQAERKLLNDRLYEANTKLATALKGEQEAKAEVEKVKLDLDRANFRAEIAEEKAKLAEAKVQDAESRLQKSQGTSPAATPYDDILDPVRSRYGIPAE